MNKNMLITGVTGFLGRELLRRFIERDSDLVVYSLVRARTAEQAQTRLEGIATELWGDEAPKRLERIKLVHGDISRDQLGITEEDWATLTACLDHIVHGAASVQFDQALEDARGVNVKGSQGAVELAQAVLKTRGTPARLDYVGTSYVAGDRVGRVLETELNVGQGFRNTYEQTKLESEEHVREAQQDLPITIHRPSIIMGDSQTGATTNFNVIYWPIRVYAKGWWSMVIGRMDTPIDVVPVDWVADAIHHMGSNNLGLGECFHLAAGPDRAANVGQMAALVQECFDGPEMVVISPEKFWTEIQPEMYKKMQGPMKTLVETGVQYMGYFDRNPDFDVTQSSRILEGTGIHQPDGETYFRRLFNYCVETNWGRKR